MPKVDEVKEFIGLLKIIFYVPLDYHFCSYKLDFYQL